MAQILPVPITSSPVRTEEVKHPHGKVIPFPASQPKQTKSEADSIATLALFMLF